MKARIPRVGFTLIELLVVIVVIACLAALILPTFRAAREKGREAQCCNNLHELHIAMWNYTRDHDGYLPYAVSVDWSNRISYRPDLSQWQHTAGWVDWRSYIAGPPAASPARGERYYSWRGSDGRACIIRGSIFSNYIGSASDTNRALEAYGVYLCPTWALRSVCLFDDAVRSYAMNINLSYANLYGITNASQQLLLADQALSGSGAALTADGAIQWATESVGTFHFLGGKGMAVYLDGHVVKYPEPL